MVLLDGESAVSAAHAQIKDGALAVQADVISPDWYSFGEAPAQSGETAGNWDVLGKLGESLLAQTGMPALASLAAQAAGLIQGADGLEDVLESYLTRMDLWIEGYRQNAVLGKLPDGTTTMSVYYDVPPAAIKSQAKQMVLDLFERSGHARASSGGSRGGNVPAAAQSQPAKLLLRAQTALPLAPS